jgi:5-methylthioadenosine/S-adenosylhomocysteine deaminase
VDDQFHVYQPGQMTWEDGVIVSVGAPESDGSAVDQMFNVSGGILMPGFYNGHNHTAMTLLRGLADDSPIFEWLQTHIWPREARLNAEDIYWGTLLGAVEMIKSGTVAFADMYFEMGAVAQATQESGLRGWLCRGLIGNEDPDLAKLQDSVRFAEEWTSSKAGGRIVPMLGPHAPYTCSPDYLSQVAQAARVHDFGIQIHLAESLQEMAQMGELYGLTPIAIARESGLFDSRLVIAHGVHITADDLVLLEGMRGGVVSCPVSNAKLGNGIMPYAMLANHGVTVGLGTDGAASTNSLDMFQEMKAMAWLQKIREGQPESFQARTALKMATRGSAEILGSAGGVLAPGRPADFIVVDATGAAMTPLIDPVANVVYAATGAQVLYTVVQGTVLMAEGILTALDEEKILREVRARMMRILS